MTHHLTLGGKELSLRQEHKSVDIRFFDPTRTTSLLLTSGISWEEKTRMFPLPRCGWGHRSWTA
jgi:hypothetical protein